MSLSFNIDSDDNTPVIVPLFIQRTNIDMGQRSRSASPVQTLYTNLKSVCEFFHKYQSTTASYSMNTREHYDLSSYMERSYCLSSHAKQLDAMQIGIDTAKSLINEDPVSAMKTLDKMVTTLFEEIDKKRVFGTGDRILKAMLIEMSAEIQVLKDDINLLQERRDPSGERCKASPIYIPWKM